MKLIARSLSVLALLGVAAVANAQLIYNDTTVGHSTWQRPVAGNPPVPPASGVGTAVRYQAEPFYVTLTGSYNMLSVGTVPINWDNYLFLYHTNFTSALPFSNVIIGNDDNPTIGSSGFNGVNLTAGTQYYLVTTGFSNSDMGAFTNTISGPSTAIRGLVGSAVPEPGSIALLVGMAGMGGMMLRRRKK